MLRVLPRGFGARQGPLGIGARVDLEREALLEIRMARASGGQLLLEGLAGGSGTLHLRSKPMLRVLLRGFGARQAPLGVGARVDFEREALLEIRMARASGGQFGRGALLRLLVRGFRLSQFPFERLTASQRGGHRGAELGLTPREVLGRGRGLQRPLLSRLVERSGDLGHLSGEEIARVDALRETGPEFCLLARELIGGSYRLRRTPLL